MFPPGVTPTFIPGLPIDTPSAEESWFYESPPPSQGAKWEAVKAWARAACPGPATPEEPGLMFHTTGGELRRRIYELTGNRDYLLGSTWRNEDEMWVVVFTGEFDFHKAAPPFEGQAASPIPPDTRCLYMGNGRTDAEDRASVGSWTPPNDEPVTFESVFN